MFSQQSDSSLLDEGKREGRHHKTDIDFAEEDFIAAIDELKEYMPQDPMA